MDRALHTARRMVRATPKAGGRLKLRNSLRGAVIEKLASLPTRACEENVERLAFRKVGARPTPLTGM
jgi:hypothetical protein